MNIFKNPKAKLPIRIGIILISLLELLGLVIMFLNYGRIISYGFFIILILMQPWWYINLTNIKAKIYTSKRFNTSVVINILLSLLIIISFPAALPEYTYDEGRKLLEETLGKDSSIHLPLDKNYVYTLNVTSFPKCFPKFLFISDRFYYYEVKKAEVLTHYMVNPLTGDILELYSDYP